MEKDIKRAFNKVKDDINFLNNEILDLKISIDEIKISLNYLTNIAQNQAKNQEELAKNQENNTSTLRHITSTYPATSTHSSTVPLEVGGLKYQNLRSSIGNEGASTDRQTDTSTDTSTHNLQENRQNIQSQKDELGSIESNIKEASEILASLDNIKKEIRLKFKHLTPREMLVFSTIYQLEEQDNKEITYNQLSKNLRLSESSVRDYVQRMMNKGIPIKKEKIDNKKVLLSISSELKKIATLNTIISLREL